MVTVGQLEGTTKQDEADLEAAQPIEEPIKTTSARLTQAFPIMLSDSSTLIDDIEQVNLLEDGSCPEREFEEYVVRTIKFAKNPDDGSLSYLQMISDK